MDLTSNDKLRIVLASVMFAICYLFTYTVPSFLFPALDAHIASLMNVAGVTTGLTVALIAWSKSAEWDSNLLSAMMRWAMITGGIAFALSVFSGPILYLTKPNHGLVVGVFAAAPLGAAIGGICRAIVWRIRSRAHTP